MSESQYWLVCGGRKRNSYIGGDEALVTVLNQAVEVGNAHGIECHVVDEDGVQYQHAATAEDLVDLLNEIEADHVQRLFRAKQQWAVASRKGQPVAMIRIGYRTALTGGTK